MISLKRICLTVFLIAAFGFPSYCTWSIIVIDPVTKEIGIAGASCTYSVYGIGAIVPGKGAIVVQAMSNSLARMKGFRMIMADATPREILKAIKDPYFDPESQQYAIICISDIEHPQTFTGSENPSHKGAVTAKGISVQENTLTNPGQLKAVLDAALTAQKALLPIQEVLMLALEAGAKTGGDKRCGDRKASSAFLTVAKPGDVTTPYINLIVNGTNEKANAVEGLRKKFNDWKAKAGSGKK
jgi:uncharacterized Ntn-hydrolase superfamily protein